jgi:predicted metal-dependent enzyme (double-stranded beta helix superfamily)
MIETLERTILEVLGPGDLSDALLRYARAFPSYRDAMPAVAGRYTRTLLSANDAFELVGMLWSPGSISPIHDHGRSRCWVVMLEGSLSVDNYERDDCDGDDASLRRGPTIRLSSGDLDHRLNDRELHKVRNIDPACNAYSLQLYAAPLSDYTIVEETTGRCVRAYSKHDAVVAL